MPDRPHPYLDFDGAGCVVTIDADDPALFGTSIEREYAEVERVAGGAVLARYVGNAIEASFAAPSEKDRMAAQLAAAVAELQPQGRS
jgi:aminodeoxyfutalosine deaminase